MANMNDISFIGIGNMGWGMALNVRRKMPKNATLFIHDINLDACERFKKVAAEEVKSGSVEIVKTSKEAAESANTVISIVPASKHVKAVYLTPGSGVIAASPSDKRLILECSTIDSETTREVGKALMDAGIGTYVDTPVSGGTGGAAAGILAFMLGCFETDSFATRVKDNVAMMGDPKKTFCCGKLGTGLAAKISNNYLSGCFNLAIAQSMAIGIRQGVDPKVLHEVIKASSGMSWMGTNKQPVPGIDPKFPSSNDYKPGFRVELMIKDLTLGSNSGKAVGINPTMADTALETYHKANEDDRCRDRDLTSVYLYVNDVK
ncbi:putative 3-hydroxyisobutyrate dehydrogenase [Rhizodiscina lignyota]|uniref:3-hydroxyisobutyrate dehydrogenase n=1 Tax=Rhizodiscina lignyota TaxID=1504668 RepID=A0A9P4IS82_9PEZI|nr:putative 3-hydroxyisobutyrate dehydrogenase [Rhizodiscina lignyota]